MAVLVEIRRIASTTSPRWPSAYPLYPNLGGRLPTFHDEPEVLDLALLAVLLDPALDCRTKEGF